MRRLAITILLAPFAGLLGLSVLAPAAAADDGNGSVADQLAPVDVMQASGLFDSVMVDAVINAIERSESNGSQALVLQLNTRGAIVPVADMTRLLQRVADAKVAIGIWVGPSRAARAYGTPAQLFGVADVTAMVAGSRIGHTGPLLPLPDGVVDLGPAADRLVTGSMSFGEARDLGVLRLDTTDEGVPGVRNMILAMDGVTTDDGLVLRTVADELDDNGNAQKVSTLVRFSELGLLEELLHTVASPPMAYLLFVIGCCLLIFELFTAGVGVAGFVGAVCAILGCYGLAALPTRPAAIVMLVLAMIAFAIDVQVGVPRLWTGIGITLFVLASWFLYEPLPGTELRPGWITLVAAIGGVMLTFIVGMPSMVRTRFATPTIGREWMIGGTGIAVNSIDPDGIAQVGEAKWRARTNRATPIAAGVELRVVAIDGVTLQVEPIEGAARDYRDRRPKES